MRTTVLSLLGATLLSVTALAGVAAADVAGTYDAKFEEVSTNCTSPLRYPNGTVQVKVKGTTVTVDVQRTPVMQGSVTKAGKISAKSRKGPTTVGGMDGVFSVAGRITPEGMLTLMMIGEYTANGRALCTQSWNVVGSRSDDPKNAGTTPKKGQKRSAIGAEPADGDDGADALRLVELPAILR